MNRNGVIGAVAAVGLVAALWYVLVPVEPDTVQSHQARAEPVAAISQSSYPPERLAPAATAPALRPAEEGMGWFPSDTMQAVAERYRAMADKRRFFDLAIKAGGGAHMTYAIIAAERCRGVSADSAAAEKERQRFASLERPTEHDRARVRQYDGCEGFAKRPFTEAEFASMEADLRGASDPAARALQMLMAFPQDRRFARLEVGALLAEGDLHLAWLLSTPMANLSVKWPAQTHGPDGGWSDSYRAANAAFRAEETAWKLAWCRVGIECERGDSMAWDIDCVGRKQCGENFAEDAERLIYRDKFDAVLERSRVIEKAIRDRNWRSLGF